MSPGDSFKGLMGHFHQRKSSVTFLSATLPWGSWPASEVPTLGGECPAEPWWGMGRGRWLGPGSLRQKELRGSLRSGSEACPPSQEGMQGPAAGPPREASHTGLFIHWLLSPYFSQGLQDRNNQKERRRVRHAGWACRLRGPERRDQIACRYKAPPDF